MNIEDYGKEVRSIFENTNEYIQYGFSEEAIVEYLDTAIAKKTSKYRDDGFYLHQVDSKQYVSHFDPTDNSIINYGPVLADTFEEQVMWILEEWNHPEGNLRDFGYSIRSALRSHDIDDIDYLDDIEDNEYVNLFIDDGYAVYAYMENEKGERFFDCVDTRLRNRNHKIISFDKYEAKETYDNLDKSKYGDVEYFLVIENTHDITM
ncbi:hypothetical protein [Taylorella equigenitalis]|uniref:Uncharacterized protein n=2 Tax=Taylorella equigenitalis TaxID=29575 RepID=A0A654KFB4_TAYEM|nr:hypothetical protein [Taylorella equigenitalis]ADU91102.1 hypothetical protein TEQUI_0146 [Taylorella equigenitalis MCE9]AFN36206.1 hypothetical protein KUI_1141 [Taylorella equigenitalis ATCC 35865]ASY39608.1 hypothetical protein CA604_05720 [Taylorella equigenitalis]WDU55937.1 hypothetical protein KPH58_05565 [Taylorella equigenitalis]VEG31980.1 Uncharacterised protein [Taylorella equigenitalis ATCC 35865]